MLVYNYIHDINDFVIHVWYIHVWYIHVWYMYNVRHVMLSYDVPCGMSCVVPFDLYMISIALKMVTFL